MAAPSSQMLRNKRLTKTPTSKWSSRNASTTAAVIDVGSSLGMLRPLPGYLAPLVLDILVDLSLSLVSLSLVGEKDA